MMTIQIWLAILFLACASLPVWSWTNIPPPARGLTIATRKATSSSLWSSTPEDWEMPPPEAMEEMYDEQEEERLSDEELEATLGDWDERVAQLNTVHLVGRIGNNPEPRYFDDGKVVVNLSLASKRKYHYMERQAENRQYSDDETDWYGLEIWGATAEFVSKYVDKGARVGVIGSLQIDEWNDKATGERRNKAKVIVREFDILESKAEAELRRSNQRGPSFYTANDNDSDSDSDTYNPSAGSAGGFFD